MIDAILMAAKTVNWLPMLLLTGTAFAVIPTTQASSKSLRYVPGSGPHVLSAVGSSPNEGHGSRVDAGEAEGLCSNGKWHTNNHFILLGQSCVVDGIGHLLGCLADGQ